jgi:hypothetical protein
MRAGAVKRGGPRPRGRQPSSEVDLARGGVQPSSEADLARGGVQPCRSAAEGATRDVIA